MKLVARLLLIGLVFVVFYQGVSRVVALGMDDEGLGLARQLLQEARRHEALLLRSQEMNAARDVKMAAIEEYLAGRLTLVETIEQFREAGRLFENDRQGFVAPYVIPDSTAELCSQVRIWVEMALENNHNAQESSSVRCRLEKEIDQQFPAQKISRYPEMARSNFSVLE